MANWNVTCVREADGEIAVVQVEADTKDQAIESVSGQGWLIEEVSPIEAKPKAKVSVPSALVQAARASVEAVIVPGNQKAESAPSSQLGYASRGSSGIAPQYRGLTIAAMVLRVFAWFYYVVGTAALLFTTWGALVGIMSMYNAPAPAVTGPPIFGSGGPAVVTVRPTTTFSMAIVAWIAILIPIVWAAALLALGAILHGLSAAALALRDIARNSFKW
jgi:hypothetical protein